MQDDVVCQRELTQVSAAWEPFEDPETRITRYKRTTYIILITDCINIFTFTVQRFQQRLMFTCQILVMTIKY